MTRASKANALNSDGTLKAGYRMGIDIKGRTYYMSPPCKQQIRQKVSECKNRKNEYKNAYKKCVEVNKKLRKERNKMKKAGPQAVKAMLALPPPKMKPLGPVRPPSAPPSAKKLQAIPTAPPTRPASAPSRPVRPILRGPYKKTISEPKTPDIKIKVKPNLPPVRPPSAGKTKPNPPQKFNIGEFAEKSDDPIVRRYFREQATRKKMMEENMKKGQIIARARARKR